MEKSSFFNSVGGDRVYKAEEWAEYFASFIGNGVFPVPSNGLQVEANSSAGVIIRAGRAWINGYFYFNTDDLNVKLNTADGVLNRIDRIVIRWDLTARTISAEVKSSAPSNNPTTPALQRDADAYELCLADVYVRAGSTAVLQSDITDQRYNSGLCGVVKGTVDQIDASMLAKQFNDYAELFKQETKLDFEAWFEEIRGILSEDLAGSLALAVDDINRSKGQPGGIATLDDGGKLVQMPTAEDVAAIPLSQKGIANGIATLNSSGKLAQMPTAADVGARPSTWMPTAENVGAVPTSRTVNGKALSGNITLSAADVGAFAAKYETLYEGLCSTNNTILTLKYPITNYKLLIVTGTTNQYGTHWAQSNVLPVGESAGEGGRKYVLWASDKGNAKLVLDNSSVITFKFTDASKLQTMSGCSSTASITGVFGIR